MSEDAVMKTQSASAVALLSVAVAGGCATGQGGTPPMVPAALQPPANEVLLLVTPATGVQIYECNATKEQPARFEWVFKAPEAELFDRAGARIGKHYAGPTWESNDGSKVVAQLKSRDAARMPAPFHGCCSRRNRPPGPASSAVPGAFSASIRSAAKRLPKLAARRRRERSRACPIRPLTTSTA